MLKFLILIIALAIASVFVPSNKDKGNGKPVANNKPSVENTVKEPASTKNDNSEEIKEEQPVKTEDNTAKEPETSEPEKTEEPVTTPETNDSEWLKSRKDLLDFPDWGDEATMQMFTMTLAYEDIVFSAAGKHANVDWMSAHGDEIKSDWFAFWSWLSNDYADYIDGMDCEYLAFWANCTTACKSFMTGEMSDSDAAQIAEAINTFYPHIGQNIF